MPRPGLPPTPVSSTEIRGKDQFELIDDFSLPPAALHSNAGSGLSFLQSEINSAEGDIPTGGAKRKRRKPSMNSEQQTSTPASAAAPSASTSAAAAAAAATAATPTESVFSLPPPPSRSRKIIQVQPEDAKGPSSKASGQSRKKSEAGKASGGGGGGGGGAPKSTAASRKTARKTAHSIIERRRRSKMNEEFETLKELVPAARGQNMHKLAILQAGIEYVRYLEDCIHGLKGVHSVQSSVKSTPFEPVPMPDSKAAASTDDADFNDDDDMDEDDEDEMEEEEAEEEKQQRASTPRPSRPASGHRSHGSVSSTPSPAIHPLSSRHYSSSSYAISTGSPSPAILPSFGGGTYAGTASSSTLPSPALLPHDARGGYSAIGSGQITPITTSTEYHALQAHAKKALACHGEEDQEVIATLTMMGTERRRSQEEKDRTDGTRGMSVRELLSG